MNKKANYSANFIKNRAGEEKMKKYAHDLGVKTELDFSDKSKLVSFVEEFQSAVRSKEGIAENFNAKLLSDGYFGPHTLKAAEYALKISTSRSSRRELQDDMTRIHARAEGTRAGGRSSGSTAPGGPTQPLAPQVPPPKRPSNKPYKRADRPAKSPDRSKEKQPKDLSAYMEYLKSLGFKTEIFTHENSGYRVCALVPPGCTKAKVFLPGDGGTIDRDLKPKGSLLKIMNNYWQQGGKMALVFLEGRRKNDKIKKYAELDKPDVFKEIIEQTENICSTNFKSLEISGYSQGGFGIKGILQAGGLNDRITKIFVNDGVWNPQIATVLKNFAAQRGKRVEVAIGKRSTYSEVYFKGNTNIYVHSTKGVGHGAMHSKFMTQALDAS